MYDGCATYLVRRFPRPSPSVFAYWKRSKAGGVEGLAMTLVGAVSCLLSLHSAVEIVGERMRLEPHSGKDVGSQDTWWYPPIEDVSIYRGGVCVGRSV